MFELAFSSACPLYVDTMNNEAIKAYGALPDRMCVVKAGKLVHLTPLGPYGYQVDEIENVIKSLI